MTVTSGRDAQWFNSAVLNFCNYRNTKKFHFAKQTTKYNKNIIIKDVKTLSRAAVHHI